MDNKQLKVLVIESNAKVAEDLKRELSSEGYKVTCAVTAEQGLLRAKAYHFNFFIVSCGNDGKQGFNFASAIVKEDGYADVPFLFVFNQKVSVDVRLRKFNHKFDLVRMPLDATEFKIKLPRLFVQEVKAEVPLVKEKKESAKNERAENNPKKILLVEDNPLNQKVLGMFISKLGFDHEIASNGQMAVDLSKEKEYAFILMDIYMPGMDGTEATELIRKNEAEGNHRAKIIAITANESAESVKRCFDSGMDDYLVKPFTVEVLKEKLV
jgi:CheY-like chemotaxis protein